MAPPPPRKLGNLLYASLKVIRSSILTAKTIRRGHVEDGEMPKI
jgi:hypothetical protein